MFFVVIISAMLYSQLSASDNFTDSDCCEPGEYPQQACDSAIIKFKWDCVQQTCVKFTYGGCNSTRNNFDTFKECQDSVAEICKNKFTKKDCFLEGSSNSFCRGYFPRYYWDNKKQACIKFIYRGCYPTNNNFETWKECQSIAVPVCLNSNLSFHE